MAGGVVREGVGVREASAEVVETDAFDGGEAVAEAREIGIGARAEWTRDSGRHWEMRQKWWGQPGGEQRLKDARSRCRLTRVNERLWMV
jgi:hypothetical protein